MLVIVTVQKYLSISTIGLSCILHYKTSKSKLEYIHVLVIAGMSTNKSELVEVNGYADTAVNDEDANKF